MAEVKWIKLSTDLFDNRKIRQIERMKNGDAIIVIWLKLLILAGDLNDGGRVYFTDSFPFTEEFLAIQFNRHIDVISAALRTFQQFKMIDIGEDGIITIRNWERYQNIEGMERIKEQNRERQQRFRDRQKDSNVTVTLRNATDKNRKDKKRIDKNKDESELRNDFRKLAESLDAQWKANVERGNRS